MNRNEGEAAQPRASIWPAPLDDRPKEPRPPGRFCYLLDADADLADEFDPRMRMVVRQIATVPVADLTVGECQLWSRFASAMEGAGVLILEGVLALDVRVGDRTATELLGAGDLLQPTATTDDDLIDRDEAWHVLTPARVAVLDGPFVDRVRPWPQITYAMLRRGARRARDLSVQRAITSHPRLEVRLALLLWHLATRWGRVEPGGIRLSLPLTHRLLGQLAGAERPSVSHALARLADGGLVTGGGADWHLHGTSREHFAWLAEHHLERGHGALRPGA